MGLLKEGRELKKRLANEELTKLYSGSDADNKYIYLDRRNARLMKFLTKLSVFVIGIVPLIGPLAEAIGKALS